MYMMPSTPLIASSSGVATDLGGLLRVGARIGRTHHHAGRHHFGILTDRKQRNRDQAGQEDDDRQHDREDRPLDEESSRCSSSPPQFGRGHAWATSDRLHRRAGEVDPLQSADDDLVARLQAGLDRRASPSLMRPSLISFRCAVLSAAEHVDVLAVLIGQHRLVVDQDRLDFVAVDEACTRANRPGVNARSALRSFARTRILPVPDRPCCRRKSTVPACGKPSSLARPTRTGSAVAPCCPGAPLRGNADSSVRPDRNRRRPDPARPRGEQGLIGDGEIADGQQRSTGRPSIGARTCVNSRLSLATATAASASSTSAWLCA